MTMSETIESAWNRSMSGRELDVDDFVEVVLSEVVRTGRVSVRVNGQRQLDVTRGAEGSSTIHDEAAVSKFRICCARLAVIFGGTSADPAALYSGSLNHLLVVGAASFAAELTFKNSPDGWFTVRVKN
jgi:hypothetical protein